MALRIALWTLALWLTAPTLAHAEPVTIAIFALAGITLQAGSIAAALLTFALTTALSIGLSLLGRLLLTPEIETPGVQLDVEIGDDSPVGFVVGYYATAGTRKYAGTWGKNDGTPNAYLVDVIQAGDMPCPDGLPGLWANGEKCTILWDEEDDNGRGFPVEEFRDGGDDNLWVRWRNGTETTADTYLRDKFGDHEDRPWKSTMIGRGCPTMIITAEFDTDQFSGQMRWVVVPPSIRLYDVRKDTTAGGSGSHRWGDYSTYEVSVNPVVIAYNIIRGIYYGSEWVFGGQNLPAFRLPAANWMAGMNECDAAIDLAGGGTEPQFRAGYEIRGDMEPLAVVEDLMKGCNGRVTEAGGIFKVLVGAPGAAVYSFTDGDILVTKGQSYKPFPGLDETHNAIDATYPEPDEMWSNKDAPSLYSDDLEAEDGDRRLPVSVNFPSVPYPVQVQRLMQAMLLDSRRFRIHSFFLPPEAWILEPNDVVSWSSARNGYENKKFLIIRIDGEPGMNQLVLLKEIDPGDYDWDADTDERATETGTMGPVRPPAQQMVGWQVDPATFKDAGGIDRRPSIKVTFSGDQLDVRAVQVQVRLEATGDLVFDGELPYGAPGGATKEVVLVGTFLPDTDYEVRGKFLPISNRLTDWSEWLPVTTPNVKITDVSVLLDGLSNDVRDVIQRAHERLDDAAAEIEALALSTVEQAGVFTERTALAIHSLNATAGVIREIKTSIEAVDGRVTAQAQLLDAVQVTIGEASAGTLWRMRASAVEDGDIEAEVNLDLRASVGGEFAYAGMQWRVGFVGGDPAQPYSEIRAIASRFLFVDDNGGNPVVPAAYVGGIWYLRNIRVQNAEIDDLAVTKAKIPFSELTGFGFSEGPFVTSGLPAAPYGSLADPYQYTYLTWNIDNESANPVTINIAGVNRMSKSGSGGINQAILVRNNTTGKVLGPTFLEGTTGSSLSVVEYKTFVDPEPDAGINSYSLLGFLVTTSGATSVVYEYDKALVSWYWGRR